jgi:hydroxyacylglutathione hydrolase
MLLRRLFHPRLAQSSYLIACGNSRDAIVIDAHRDVELYLAAARSEGVRIIAVAETHVHADFLSGSRELAGRTGARLYLSGESRGPWSYTDAFVQETAAVLLHDGYTIRIGAVRLDVSHTPGHTPEHITFLVTDTADAAEPMGAVTGDFLFVGDVGRPDLLERAVHVRGSAAVSARQLFQSITRLAKYADYVQVWPGHSAGSACGRGLSAVPHSTLGYERRHNWALRTAGEDAFVAEVLRGQPEAPAYFADMKRLNAAGSLRWDSVTRPVLAEPDEVAAALAGHTLIIDTRSAAEYAAGHLPGTINIPLDRSFLTWAGSLIPIEAEVMLIGDESQLGGAVTDLALIGIDHVVGYAGPGVMDAWRHSGRPLETVVEASVTDLVARLPQGGVTIVDVRGSAEWEAGHIAGAVHVPLASLPGWHAELPQGAVVIVHCQGGSRSAIATSVLMAHGFGNVQNLRGGLDAWQEAGQRIVTGPGRVA